MNVFLDHLSPGLALGHYTLEERVGRGGHAEVWRASSPDSGGHIALKIMRSREMKDYARFRQEAAVQKRLSHPNIVQVHGLRVVDGFALIEQEFVPGQTLLEWLTKSRPTLALCNSWILQVLDGLEAAHAQGILHRDIKPSNILIDERQRPPRAKLADFGIARMLHDPSADLTAVGMVLGTPGYMAPEQIRGLADIDLRVDLFALGSLAYRLLSGRSPFGGGSQYEVLSRTCQGEYPPLASLAPDLPEHVVSTVEAALSVRRSDRPRDAAAFRALWTGQERPQPVPSASTLVDVSDALLGAPGAASGPPLTNRRLHRDRFHGREAELKGVLSVLAGSSHRLVTLKGPGGVGKTRLADEVLAGVDPGDWPGGIWRCNLTAARSRSELVEALRAVFDAKLPGDEPLPMLGQALRERGRCLLLLDNLEQAIEAAADVIEVLCQLAPRLVILATSRVPVGLRGERVIAVEALCRQSAVALFTDRAQGVVPSFQPGPGEQATLEEVVARLEGFPLAVELAASRLRVLSLDELSARLAAGNKVLSRRRRGTEARHSSVEDAIAWSWSLLEPWEQLALAQCSVFRGGFALDAASEVLCLDAFPESPWELDVIESLVDHSLVRLARGSDGVRRFELYVSIRDFALAQLKRVGAVCSSSGESLTGPEQCARHQWRHAEYYARFWGDAQQKKLQGPRAAASLQALARELPNLAAVQELTPTASCPEHPVLQSRAGLVAAIVFQRTGQTRGALRVLEEAWRRPGIEADLLAQLGSRLAVVCRQVGDLNKALSVITQTLENLPEDSLHARRAKLLQHRGNITRQMGDFEGAKRLLRHAMKHAESAGASALVAQITGDMGSVALEAGDYEQAERLYEADVRLHLKIGLPDDANLARGNLGELALARGELMSAREIFEACIEAARSRGHRRQELIFLVKSARTAFEVGAHRAASSRFEQALEINVQVHDQRRQAQIQCGLGELELRRGDLGTARSRLEEAAALAAELDSPTAGYAQALLGLLAAQTDRQTDAHAHLQLAQEHAAASGPLAGLDVGGLSIEVLVALGKAAEATGVLARLKDKLDTAGFGSISSRQRWLESLEELIASVG